MKYKKWSPEIWDRIDKAIATAKESHPSPAAAFDADGTLWDTDLGESFFKFQIKNKVLGGLPEQPWEHYRKWKDSGDPRPAYLWLAQINRGHKIDEVRRWAEENVRQFDSLPVFDEQARLIEKLQKNKIQVFIVTASVKWAVEPGAARLGVPSENVIGVATKVIRGLVSDQQEGEMTYREGKARALLNAVENRKPFLCSGNSMGDITLLEISSDVALVVGAAPEKHELFATEEELRQNGKTRGWLIHRF